MSDQELKPCPFCGGKGLFKRILNKYSIGRFVQRAECDAKSMVDMQCRQGEREYLIDLWNTRAHDPMLEELARALQEVLKYAVILSEEYLSTFEDCSDDHCVQGWENLDGRRLSRQKEQRKISAKIPTVKGETMTPTMEEVAGWLREDAECFEMIGVEFLRENALRAHAEKVKDRAAQVEAMGQQSDTGSLALEEMAGALMAADKFADDYHWAICSSLRGKLKQALQKYQQSKVQHEK